MKRLLSCLVQWMIRRWGLDDGLCLVQVQNTYGYRQDDTLAIWAGDGPHYVKVRFICGPEHLIVRSWPKKVTTRDGIQVMPKVY
jgi:hypothetical protein